MQSCLPLFGLHLLDGLSDPQVDGGHSQYSLIQIKRFEPMLHHRYFLLTGCSNNLLSQLAELAEVLTLLYFSVSSLGRAGLVHRCQVLVKPILLHMLVFVLLATKELRWNQFDHIDTWSQWFICILHFLAANRWTIIKHIKPFPILRYMIWQKYGLLQREKPALALHGVSHSFLLIPVMQILRNSLVRCFNGPSGGRV